MKPLIYYDFDKTPDDKITINKERLNEVLEEVYNAGVEDGRRENKSNSWTAYRDGDTYKLTTNVKNDKNLDLEADLNKVIWIDRLITYNSRKEINHEIWKYQSI